SRGSPSQLTLLVNQIVHKYIQPITHLVVGFFLSSGFLSLHAIRVFALSNKTNKCDNLRAV
ncbi:hypothetical protein R8O05_29760, partial [Vibrio sp. 1865]|uniref:hypothetical protein n=1 Tax=Vibrio sp. 1865 TaxID=3074580 RepID=UPI002966567F